MPDYSRGSVLAGEEIELRVVFVDSMNNLIDPDGSNIGSSSVLPVLYIYDESVPTETIAEEMESGLFTSAIAGPLNSTRLSQGYFSYTYLVPTAYEAGVWHDVWLATVNTIQNLQMLNFTVEEAITIDPQSIGQNTMIYVTLDDSIANDTNDSLLEPTKLFYTTTYSPLYASPDLIRMELGPWIDYISDDTLALMAHWSSKEAEFIQGPSQDPWGNIKLARTKFVIYDAALKCVMQPGAGQQAGATSGGKKQLGDLIISQGTVNATVGQETIDWLREQRNAWWRVVNAGGNIVPGQGLTPTFAVKGMHDPDRRLIGRLWESPSEQRFVVPTANTRILRYGHRRAKTGYQEPIRRR